MAYNIQIVKYPTGTQVRVYSDLVGVNTYKPIDDDLFLDYMDDLGNSHLVKLPSETGRISLENKFYLNPFTEQYEKVRTVQDIEYSEKSSRNRTKKKLYYDLRSNYWKWFVTLTFDGKKVDRYNYDECVKKMSNWLDICRRKCPDMQYILVVELHKDGAFHFHGVFNNCDELGFTLSGKRDKRGRPVYNIGKYKLGFATATLIDDLEKVCNYIGKYITKELCAVTFGKKRYWKSRNLLQADITTYTFDGFEKNDLMQLLNQYSNFHKRVEGYLSVDYFELPSEFELVDCFGEIL